MMIIDLHTHTKPLSKCSSLEISDLVQVARRIKLDGICLTEHNALWPEDEVRYLSEKYDFLLLRGMEVTTNYGHILVFGLKEYHPGSYFIENLIHSVREAGGLMFLSHPFRQPGYLEMGYGKSKLSLTPEVACQRPIFKIVDGIEVFNKRNPEEEDRLTIEVGKRLSLPIVGGSDAHLHQEIGAGVTIFYTDIKDERDFLRQLKTGNYRAAKLF
jgi:hypothetical protein